ncbi:GNAT family N-acetyltransferase [Pararhodospirillum photometricum]|nr:GNAT family protein [Pararhodospirillum photometricum]
MTEILNALGQPVGALVPDWQPRPRPSRSPMVGRYGRLEPLDPARHAEALYAAHQHDPEGRNWTYLWTEPFRDFAPFLAWLESIKASEDPLYHVVIDATTEQPVGMAAFMRIDPTHGVIEVGHVSYTPLMQRTPLATEVIYLMARRVFDELGYRRFEWKCDSLNARSRRSALRFGFTFEGIFRQHLVVKGRNRDTAWFSMLDHDWAERRHAFEAWLDPSNFDAEGQQKTKLTPGV